MATNQEHAQVLRCFMQNRMTDQVVSALNALERMDRLDKLCEQGAKGQQFLSQVAMSWAKGTGSQEFTDRDQAWLSIGRAEALTEILTLLTTGTSDKLKEWAGEK